MLVRYYNVQIKSKFNFTPVPMKHFFTLETSSPSEKTINIIKQIAYSCRAMKVGGQYQMFCLN